MSTPSRLVPRACRLCRASPALRRTFASATATSTTTTTEKQTAWPQCHPRGEYYDILLRDPTPYATVKAERPPSSAAPTSSPAARSSTTTASGKSTAPRTYETISSRTAYSGAGGEKTAEERARVIFGSRLLGPAERADRAAGRQAKSTSIAGVVVPPRPEEPDNCCMSGCVNCVWDLYREDMEEWTLKSNEAKKRLAEQAAANGAGASPVAKKMASAGDVAGSSIVKDGGGSKANWPTGALGDAKIAKDMWADDVFQNVPVGIREFMKQEKRLKEKHQREGTSGG